MATGLGEFRDCDIFYQIGFGEALVHPFRPADEDSCESGRGGLRSVSYAKASDLIEAETDLIVILDLQAFIRLRSWRLYRSYADFAILSQPAENLTRETLNFLIQRVLKRGKDFLQRSDEDRHEYRIDFKNLQYNKILFGCLFASGKTRKACLADLAELQGYRTIWQMRKSF